MQPRIKKILGGIADNGRVAGAYIFSGPPGSGKKEVAREFAGFLGCKKQDYFEIAPQISSLKIEQVRELQSWVRYGPSAGRFLVAVVEAADTLTDEAAAAFLKTLEEPPRGVVFILLVEREDKIPETIISRCQKVIFSEKKWEWQSDEAAEYFEELRGAGRKNIFELLQLSSRLEKERERIEELLYRLAYFARYELGNSGYARIILDALRSIKRRANLRLTLEVMCLKFSRSGAI